MLTQKRLREVLHYNPEAGIFRFAKGTRKGKVAGTLHDDRGFPKVSIDNERHMLHRLPVSLVRVCGAGIMRCGGIESMLALWKDDPADAFIVHALFWRHFPMCLSLACTDIPACAVPNFRNSVSRVIRRQISSRRAVSTIAVVSWANRFAARRLICQKSARSKCASATSSTRRPDERWSRTS